MTKKQFHIKCLESAISSLLLGFLGDVTVYSDQPFSRRRRVDHSNFQHFLALKRTVYKKQAQNYSYGFK